MLFLCIEDIDNQKGLLLQLSSGVGIPRAAVYNYTVGGHPSRAGAACMSSKSKI